ncbi:unnamed protein product, partial [Meganyctiphanes norvegica]
RSLVSASYASYISNIVGYLTWPLILPPAIGLFIIEYYFCIIYKFVVDIRHSYAVYNLTSSRKTGIIKHIHEYIYSLYAWVRLHNCKKCISFKLKNIEKKILCIVYLFFEANSVECLITSYTYFAFAVAINTASLTAGIESFYLPLHTPLFHSIGKAPRELKDLEALDANQIMTQQTFNVLQFLAFTSFFLNLLLVQLEGKCKVRCFAYSLIFLLFMGMIYIWVKNDLTSFGRLFSTNNHDNYNFTQETIKKSLS